MRASDVGLVRGACVVAAHTFASLEVVVLCVKRVCVCVCVGVVRVVVQKRHKETASMQASA